MCRASKLVRMVAMLALASNAYAQSEDETFAPLPDSSPVSVMDKIAPAQEKILNKEMLTTRKTPKPAPDSDAPPPLKLPSEVIPSHKPATYEPQKIPFGKATPTGPEIPSAPHRAVATPIENIDAVEASEPAPPTPVAPEADPASQSHEEPTELTSPIFDSVSDNGAPRRMMLRVLNKVTAQAATYRPAPGEKVRFGQLEITAATCQNSVPTSQPDHAGLLDVYELLPDGKEKKLLFRGWMYASSPSISGLEHPVYDVTMVDCEIAVPAATKTSEKPEKSTKKMPTKKSRS